MSVASKKRYRETISLNGKWNFITDPNDQIDGKRIEPSELHGQIKIPGSWEEQGYGEPSNHQPIGTWKKVREYTGAAWYAREITVPNKLQGHRFQLVLAGAHWFTKVWIDGEFVDEGESLVTDHTFDVTPYVKPGVPQRVVISVDNRLQIPLEESHIHSYHTATNWGGITGEAKIEAYPQTYIDAVEIKPNVDHQLVEFDILLGNLSRDPDKEYSISVEVLSNEGKTVTVDTTSTKDSNQENKAQLTVDLGSKAICWSDDTPYLYRTNITLVCNGEMVDVQHRRFGLRTITTKGKHILLNGETIFLRGYVDCCIFPQTGYPIWDQEHYRKQFRIVKQYGFNHVRLHGWTAPKPFWEAADEEGMIVQTELPHWSGFYLKRGEKPNDSAHEFLNRELLRVLKDFNEHPSFTMLSLGNELISAEGHENLNEMVKKARSIDSTRIYTDNTGFGELPAHDREGDYFIPTLNWHPPYEIDFAAGPNTMEDYNAVTSQENKPLIAHEHGQFTMYARPSEESKYRGALRPSWLNTMKETLEKKGLDDRVDEFINASGALQVSAIKESMERARRTKGLSGIQLLDIRDFPGQGHATTGVLDVFWENKGMISSDLFRRFNDERVLLMRSPTRTFYAGESIEVIIELSNFGKNPVRSGKLKWRLDDGEKTYDSGTVSSEEIHSGSVEPVCRISVVTPENEVHSFTLIAELETEDEVVVNQWDFWAFPRPQLHDNVDKIRTNMSHLQSYLYGAQFRQKLFKGGGAGYPEEPNINLAITDQMSMELLQYLLDGGKAWLMLKEGRQHDEVITRYLPTFWNYLWFPAQVGTTMGMMINEHPSLGRFPHDGKSNWQWYYLVDHSISLGLDLVPQIEPIVEVVDNFNRTKKLSYAFETQVGKGKLFVSSFKFHEVNDLKRPETAFLMGEIINYLLSENFDPASKLTVGELLSLFKLKAH